jgi:hypothetical protein
MCFTTFLCAIANGYDGSLMTGLIAVSLTVPDYLDLRFERRDHLPPQRADIIVERYSSLSLLWQMDQFQDVFHSDTTGSKVSVIFSMYTV